jgi:hypothetical protein
VLFVEAFRADSVPAFAAMRAFDLLRGNHPDYTYREAALNSTNIASLGAPFVRMKVSLQKAIKMLDD